MLTSKKKHTKNNNLTKKLKTTTTKKQQQKTTCCFLRAYIFFTMYVVYRDITKACFCLVPVAFTNGNWRIKPIPNEHETPLYLTR
jgi:predicted RND superfamily exporter protein